MGVSRAAHRQGRRLQILDGTGAGPDHPVMSNCPESRYLKVIWGGCGEPNAGRAATAVRRLFSPARPAAFSRPAGSARAERREGKFSALRPTPGWAMLPAFHHPL